MKSLHFREIVLRCSDICKIAAVILSNDALDRIARTRKGSLEETPYAVLLFALARAQRTVVLQLNRRQLTKEIIFEDGVPVQCSSNLVHETLSRFMLSTGRIDEITANDCLSQSCARSVRFGDILIEKGIITAEELLKVLQQNLARKLLDGFSWRDGTFRIGGIPDAVDSTLKVNVAQLIVFGVTRFATQQQVDASIGPLIGKALAIPQSPFFSLDEIRLNNEQRAIVDKLDKRPMRIDELAAAPGVPYPDLTRLLYALTLIGAVVEAETIQQQESRPPQRSAQPVPPEPLSESTPEQAPCARPGQRDELMRLVLNYRRKDPFELFGLDEDASNAKVETRFLEFSEKFAPWQFDPKLVSDARGVFLAGVRAFSQLTDPARREQVIERRRVQTQPVDKADLADRFRIKTELLDPAVQYREGKKLMEEGQYRKAMTQLEYASDLDPQNAIYRSELAYCRFMDNPHDRVPALDDLKETLRIDPRCGLAMYFSGEIFRHMGNYAEAEAAFRSAIKPMSPDRRPIDALRILASDKKR